MSSGPSDDRSGDPGDTDDIRCDCGRLLARKVPGGVELKCRRCGRTHRLTIELLAGGPE